MSHLSMEELSASLDRALTGADLERSLAHLSMCSRCRERQTRLALHDDALRRLLADDPDDRVMDELARRSEAIATAIVRGLAVPPIITSTPLDDARDVPRRVPVDNTREELRRAPQAPQSPIRVAVERLAKFEPPAAAAPPTVQQDPTATPAAAEAPLPPPRDPSRLLRRPNELDPSAALDVTPRMDIERIAPTKPEPQPRSLTEDYDAFNDQAYAGPTARQLPPMLGRPAEKAEKQEDQGDSPSPKPREYRHGGVRRDAPAPAERTRESADRRSEAAAERVEGFGVKRKGEPAWSRLGLQPDPQSPGSFRDSLTGASITPPIDSRRPAGRRTPSKPRNVVMAPALTVAGVLAVAVAVLLALRIPTGVSVQFGRPKAVNPTTSNGGLELHGATTPPPVDVAVPSPSGTGTTLPATTTLCGQVLDTAGQPVAGALLTVVESTLAARSDTNGHFCLVAPAGLRSVEVVDPRVVPGSPAATRRIQLDFVAGAPEARVVLR
jgi:hypothetical protein